jgi:hypothetical protein
MRFYELRPVAGTETHPDWRLSDYRGPCRVAALDETSARAFAAKEFAAAAPRGWSATSAWNNPALVLAVVVESGALPGLPLGTVLKPAEGYPGFAPSRKARRRASEADDDI